MGDVSRLVVMVAFEGMQLLDLAGPVDVFDGAAAVLDAAARGQTAPTLPDAAARGQTAPTLPDAAVRGQTAPTLPDAAVRGHASPRGYRLVVATADGLPVRTSSGVRIAADAALPDLVPEEIDSLIVTGALSMAGPLRDGRLMAALRRLAAGARRVCSVCVGAFLLAEAGLLDGRHATTHWAACDQLAARYPAVTVAPDRIFVRDGSVYTSAGVTAGVDLALALVEEDHGGEVARTVARWLVVFLQRPGGQSQFSERLRLPVPAGSPLRAVVDAIVANPAADHRVPELAVRAALSERHLSRMFLAQTRTTPARFVERVRVEAARELLEATDLPVDAVASRSGFGSAETMRRAFLRVVEVGPGEYRQRFRTARNGHDPAFAGRVAGT
jgi:transcriptional regulator GlxA family with amidase domain